MIVTCPSCSTPYKINEAKIKGRGAKITCPKCSHRFVVYRPGEGPNAASDVPNDLATMDFSAVGITWRVRKGGGVTIDFHDLATLKDYLEDEQIKRWDKITYDMREWVPLDSIANIEEYFWDVYQRAENGEINVADPDEEEEDESDAPTTIVGRRSSLASDIRRAVQDAMTPAPAGQRASGPNTASEEEPAADEAPEEPEAEEPAADEAAEEPAAEEPAADEEPEEDSPEEPAAAPVSPRETGAIEAPPQRIDPKAEAIRKGEAEPAPEKKPEPPKPQAEQKPAPSGGGMGLAVPIVVSVVVIGVLGALGAMVMGLIPSPF